MLSALLISGYCRSEIVHRISSSRRQPQLPNEHTLVRVLCNDQTGCTENRVVVRTLVDDSVRQRTQKTLMRCIRRASGEWGTHKLWQMYKLLFQKVTQRVRKKELLGWIAGNERKTEQTTFGSWTASWAQTTPTSFIDKEKLNTPCVNSAAN